MGENGYDDLKVYLAETSSPITAGSVPSGTLLGTYQGASSWQQATISIPASNSGTTKQLVFTWRNNGEGGTQPPIAVDNIVVTVLSPVPSPSIATDVLPGSTLTAAQKPSAEGITKTGYVNDGKWYTVSGIEYTEFVFGESGTPVTDNTTLYLKWTINTYTVTFVDRDGTVLSSQAVEHGSAATAPAEPTHTGYTFNRWDKAFDEVTGNLTVTAVYEINTYTITYDLDGGTVSPTNRASYTAESPAFTLNNPTKSGYTFAGWTGTNGTTPQTAVSVPLGSTGDRNYVANWAYTVTFNANGGTVSPTSGTTGEGWALAELPTPTRNGYTFNGWFTAATGGDEVTESRVYSANTTIYAQWTPITYTVTFNATGGEVTPESGTTAPINSNYAWRIASLPRPTKTGYTFDGWYTAETGGTQVTTNTIFSADATIYARWTLAIYTITFNANSGTVSPTFDKTGEDWTLAELPTPIRTGFTFNGWYTAATGGTKVTESTVYSANTIIYAQWAQINYTVTFDANGGEVTPEFGTTGVNWILASLPTPIRTGYTFDGWYTAETGGTQVIKSATGFSADATIYARWTINTYGVQFVDYDGSYLFSQAVYYGGAATAPTEPFRWGYTFIGWDTEFDVVTDHLIVTALYKINTYTVTFVDHDGAELSLQVVEHDGAATAPTEPMRPDYTFTGWDTDFSWVTENLTVTAQYEINAYAAPFKAANNRLITPTSNGITLTAKTNATIEVYNLSGKLISRQEYLAGNYSISFGHLPKGVYLIQARFSAQKAETLRLTIH
jgi:uncharacterized repeat protein (TIGR02543 family)